MSTIGAFLKLKAGNMAMWLYTEGYMIPGGLHDVSELQATILAQHLNELHDTIIEPRDFDAVLKVKAMTPDVAQLIQFVRERPQLHDKFWRYLTLFSDTVGSKHV